MGKIIAVYSMKGGVGKTTLVPAPLALRTLDPMRGHLVADHSKSRCHCCRMR